MDRENKGIFGKLVIAIGIAMSLIHIYLLGFNPITPWILYNIHLAFGIVLVFFLYPATKRSPMGSPSFLDVIMALLAVAAAAYFSIEMEELIYRIGVAPTAWDLFFSAALVIMVLEITRRTSGLILPTFALMFLLYARYGGWLPGILGHRGYDWSRIISYVTGLDAIFSVSLGASAQFVFLLLLFSAFLHATGAGKFFIDFATGVAGDKRGGPAKIAVLASALFGTISGNSVANVVSTGVFTIPMMKKIGYRPTFAGAVEAVASTGGQIMPPIMGSAAFIMAQLIGVSYLKVAASALIPAVLYFLSVIFMVDLEAGKYGLSGVPKEELPSVTHVLRTQGYLVTPVLVLIFVLVVLRVSVIRAALWAIASVLVVT
ncbi:MAG: TRAP transporter fused permease subunit, partial [Bacillota bacterium]